MTEGDVSLLRLPGGLSSDSRAEVDSASTSLEQQKTVKVLEQEGVGLVNSDEDGLSRSGELAEETDDLQADCKSGDCDMYTKQDKRTL